MADDDRTNGDAHKVTELIKDSSKIAMVTSRAPDGTLTSRPLALQEAEFDGELWFYVERSSSIAEHVAEDPQVNVAVGSQSTWVSLTGAASVVEDDAKKEELWNAVVEAWFPDGPKDPDVALLRVSGDSAEYWDTPGRVATLLSFAKAKATGEAYDGGENEKVEL